MKPELYPSVINALKFVRFINSEVGIPFQEQKEITFGEYIVKFKGVTTSNAIETSTEFLLFKGNKNIFRIWIDNEDLFDKTDWPVGTVKGTEISIHSTDVFIDTCGVHGLWFNTIESDTPLQYNKDSLTESLFQNSLMYEGVPSAEEFTPLHDALWETVDAIKQTYVSVNQYERFTDTELEEVLSAFKTV